LDKDINLSYVAEKCSGYVRFKVHSIHISAPIELIQDVLSRRETKMILDIVSHQVCAHKAHKICTVNEDHSRLYRWIFKPNIKVTDQPHNHDISVYDCDSDTKNVNTTFIKMVTVDDQLELKFTRYVYFPFTQDGMQSKHLNIKLKQIDFKATMNRAQMIRSSPIKMTESDIYTLERSLRQYILLKIMFDTQYRIHQIELIVDKYNETIEQQFIV